MLAEVKTKQHSSGAVLAVQALMLCWCTAATCYLNSWLQTLFNLNVFRQVNVHVEAVR